MMSLFFHSYVLKDYTSGYSLCDLSVFPACLLLCSVVEYKGMIVTSRETDSFSDQEDSLEIKFRKQTENPLRFPPSHLVLANRLFLNDIQ